MPFKPFSYRMFEKEVSQCHCRSMHLTSSIILHVSNYKRYAMKCRLDQKDLQLFENLFAVGLLEFYSVVYQS